MTGCWWVCVTRQTAPFRSWPTSTTGKATPLMTSQTMALCHPWQSWRRGQLIGSISSTGPWGKSPPSVRISPPARACFLNWPNPPRLITLRLLWLYLRARHGRDGHSYCSVKGCERVKVMSTTSSKQISNCTAKAYPKYSKPPSAAVPMPAPNTQPCKGCGANQVRAAAFENAASRIYTAANRCAPLPACVFQRTVDLLPPDAGQISLRQRAAERRQQLLYRCEQMPGRSKDTVSSLRLVVFRINFTSCHTPGERSNHALLSFRIFCGLGWRVLWQNRPKELICQDGRQDGAVP